MVTIHNISLKFDRTTDTFLIHFYRSAQIRTYGQLGKRLQQQRGRMSTTLPPLKLQSSTSADDVGKSIWTPRTLLEKSEAQEANVRELFQTFDCDKNGRIDIDEVHDLLRLIRHTRANQIGIDDCTLTAREKDEEMLRTLPRLIPEYSERHGMTFNQFVYFYNHVLHMTDDTVVKERIHNYVTKNKKIRNYANHDLVENLIQEFLNTDSEITSAQAKALRSIEHGTTGYASDIVEREIAQKKLRISQLLSLYAKTKSKMQLSQFKRELSQLTVMIENAEEEMRNIRDHHWRRDLLHDQIIKGRTHHYELDTGRSLNSSVSILSPHSKHSGEDAKEQTVNYIAMAQVANAFIGGDDNKFKLKLTPAIKKALIEHITELGQMRVLDNKLRDHAIKIVTEENLYAVFAFYKFANNDSALVSYLKFHMGKSKTQRNKDMKSREMKLLRRAASYEQFMQERRDIYNALKQDIKEKKICSDTIATISPTKKKKKKPRWLVLYEDAAKKHSQVK